MKIGNLLLVGGLKKYRSIEPDSIAQCMLWVANNDCPNGKIESDKIIELAKQ